MKIEKRISLTEAELKAAITQYLKFCDLKPDEPIRFVFRNGESVEQVLFTDVDVLWIEKPAPREE